jgi:hypothetical protein
MHLGDTIQSLAATWPALTVKESSGRRRLVGKMPPPGSKHRIRRSCTARAGAYGMADPGEPSCVIVGNHFHDNSPSSTTDPRLVQDARESAVDDPRLARGGKARKAARKLDKCPACKSVFIPF